MLFRSVNLFQDETPAEPVKKTLTLSGRATCRQDDGTPTMHELTTQRPQGLMASETSLYTPALVGLKGYDFGTRFLSHERRNGSANHQRTSDETEREA